MNACPHQQKMFARVSLKSASVGEYCKACGINVRGGGVWVSHAELRAHGLELEQLPSPPVKRATNQLGLFGGRS